MTSSKDVPLVECVPNFSEGRDEKVIEKIADTIREISSVKLLHIDQGKAANRTVMTFAGSPDSVAEAAFASIQQASQLIDMRQQKGEHPRIGATDVCPLVPVSQTNMEATVNLAHQLGERVGKELAIPVYMYEFAATEEKRKNLANIRRGEYEGLSQKLKQPAWEPDYGPSTFNAKSGATVIGARHYLIAFNINLNTSDVHKAQRIAAEIRQEREQHDQYNGLKAIGWYIEEYKSAQVSMNITNYKATPLHIAFKAVKEKARQHQLNINGAEIIGLVPLEALIDSGHYFANQTRNPPSDQRELIDLSIEQLQLNTLQSFDPEQRILEYLV